MVRVTVSWIKRSRMTSELKALKQAHKIHRPACPSALSSFKDATTETRNLEANTNTPFYLSLRACSRDQVSLPYIGCRHVNLPPRQALGLRHGSTWTKTEDSILPAHNTTALLPSAHSLGHSFSSACGAFLSSPPPFLLITSPSFICSPSPRAPPRPSS